MSLSVPEEGGMGKKVSASGGQASARRGAEPRTVEQYSRWERKAGGGLNPGDPVDPVENNPGKSMIVNNFLIVSNHLGLRTFPGPRPERS